MSELRKRIACACRELGVKETSRRLGMTPEPVLRLAADLPVQRGTEALAAAHVHRLDPQPPRAA